MAPPAYAPTDIITVDSECTTLSDYDAESAASSTQSLSTSILEQTFANGRRYHRKSQGTYFMPSDEVELDRLDMAHHLCLTLFDGELYTAPIKGRLLHNVLDCGTGTGIWALDFGETHPESQVLGVDLAPIQPSWVYPNVKFETDDVEKDWLWKDFDFIHARMMSVSIRDWTRFAQQMFKNTVPGGWVEIVDHPLGKVWCDDGTGAEDSAMWTYMRTLETSMREKGINVDIDAAFIEKVLLDAGFVDVKVTSWKMPFGTWPKDKKMKRAGRIVAEIALTGFEAYGIAAMIAAGTPAEEARKICDDARDIVRKGKEHWYNILFSVAGRKPE